MFKPPDFRRKSKSLLPETTFPIDEGDTPSLRSRLYLPGFPGLKPPIPNRDPRPLTAKIVNISRISHRKQPSIPKKDCYFLLPHFSEVEPKGYPKLRKRPNSLNPSKQEVTDNSKSNINNRYKDKNTSNERGDSKERKSASFYLRKPKSFKPTLTKEAQSSLLKTIGKVEEVPYLHETEAINPYDTFQKLLRKNKKEGERKYMKKESFSQKAQAFDFSLNEQSQIVKNENPEKFPESNKKVLISPLFLQDISKVEENRKEETSIADESELSNLKIKSIEEFIEMIKNHEIQRSEFVYLLRNRQGDSYDLKVVSYTTITRLRAQQYFTLSSKGLTCFEKGLPKEFIFLGDWLRERDQYFALKSLSFFKKFRKWKTLKKWQKLLQIRRNKKTALILSESLFQVHSIYQKILLKHRAYTASLENLRLMDFSGLMEYKTLQEFTEIQANKRRLVFDYLQVLSAQMHSSCQEGLNVLLERVKEHIRSELSEEDEQFGLIKKSEELQRMGQTRRETTQQQEEGPKNLIEALNLPDKLSYQHRSLLRGECLKVLRFTYLLDFLTMDSLAGVYMSSLRDFLEKIRKAKLLLPNERIRINSNAGKKLPELDPLILILARFVPDYLRRRNHELSRWMSTVLTSPHTSRISTLLFSLSSLTQPFKLMTKPPHTLKQLAQSITMQLKRTKSPCSFFPTKRHLRSIILRGTHLL